MSSGLTRAATGPDSRDYRVSASRQVQSRRCENTVPSQWFTVHHAPYYSGSQPDSKPIWTANFFQNRSDWNRSQAPGINLAVDIDATEAAIRTRFYDRSSDHTKWMATGIFAPIHRVQSTKH